MSGTSPDAAQNPPSRLVLRWFRLPGMAPLDLTVTSGELVAVSGWASADLLWAVAGLGTRTEGEVIVDGRPVEDHEQALEAGVALIPQGNALASLLTAYENVLLPLAERRRTARPAGATDPQFGEDLGTVAREALAAVGLVDSADHLVEELSGGQQQRVGIARALAMQPRLLLADQVTTDLDPGNRSRVVALLRDLAGSGAAVLLATDDSAITEQCDRTVSLESLSSR